MPLPLTPTAGSIDNSAALATGVPLAAEPVGAALVAALAAAGFPVTDPPSLLAWLESIGVHLDEDTTALSGSVEAAATLTAAVAVGAAITANGAPEVFEPITLGSEFVINNDGSDNLAAFERPNRGDGILHLYLRFESDEAPVWAWVRPEDNGLLLPHPMFGVSASKTGDAMVSIPYPRTEGDELMLNVRFELGGADGAYDCAGTVTATAIWQHLRDITDPA